MGEPYIDVAPDAVASAGRTTAGCSDAWASWAGRSAAAVRQAASDAQDGLMTTALESYLGTINPSMQRMATNTEALGGNAVTGASTMAGSDNSAAGVVARAGGTADASRRYLSRPITAQ